MRLAAALVVLCAALFALSLVTGLAAAPAGQSLKALAIDDGTPLSLVMREIRLPRALLAVMVGASLGLSGAALQGYLRNPLAEPGLIGISGAAALGAVLAIQTGLVLTHPLALPLSEVPDVLVLLESVDVLSLPDGQPAANAARLARVASRTSARSGKKLFRVMPVRFIDIPP